mmetsp:Transcript_14910/g.14385  ORF Transcript_14910/g.14385 Transcript_14910/m.14385 type:complete len:85 (-) Transcript_14910:166-420(-)
MFLVTQTRKDLAQSWKSSSCSLKIFVENIFYYYFTSELSLSNWDVFLIGTVSHEHRVTNHLEADLTFSRDITFSNGSLALGFES